MLQYPADPVGQPRIDYNGGPPLDLMQSPRWGRAKEAAGHYGVGLTTIYARLNAGRFTTRKVGAIRLLWIGAARGIDIEEPPPLDAVPVSRRPENAGRTWRGRAASAALPRASARKKTPPTPAPLPDGAA